MTQREAVISALEEHGGYATLGDIYRSALSKSGCQWGTKTPHATIRRILQTDKRTFFRIRPGLWGIKGKEDQILDSLKIGREATKEQIERFDHAYYQGLLAEWGKLKNHQIHIPSQDRNKRYLQSYLGSLSLAEMPQFTYPGLVEKAGYVDVIWFSNNNDRNLYFPVCMFEVEHTTDFTNSLNRFYEFRYFTTRFVIVAPGLRRREFESKVSGAIYGGFSKRVELWDYETVARLYSIELQRQHAYEEAGMSPL